jgi:BMFP domain-containing protein YqiC
VAGAEGNETDHLPENGHRMSSIAHETRIAELERRISEIAGMSTIEFRKHLVELELRIEKLEQRGKPGPKPKEQK